MNRREKKLKELTLAKLKKDIPNLNVKEFSKHFEVCLDPLEGESKGLVIHEMDGNWVMGTFDGKGIGAKIFSTPSVFGIDDGRVSKLHYNGCDYERGWDRGEKNRKVWGPAVEALEEFAQSGKFGAHLREIERQRPR